MMTDVGAESRPLLLLDVGGVLQPLGRAVPRGFERFTDDESNVVLCRQHGVWLSRLASSFDLVWATTWQASANRFTGRRLGLPDLPHVDLSDLPRSGTRKLTMVQQYVGDRSLAWVDDELYEDAVAWAGARIWPTLLLRTASRVGLTEADFLSPVEFAEGIAGTAN